MNKDVFASLNSSEQLGSSCAGKELWEKQRSATVVKMTPNKNIFYFILRNVKKMCENNRFILNHKFMETLTSVSLCVDELYWLFYLLIFLPKKIIWTVGFSSHFLQKHIAFS